jgi:hypothetical protein
MPDAGASRKRQISGRRISSGNDSALSNESLKSKADATAIDLVRAAIAAGFGKNAASRIFAAADLPSR